MKFKQLILLGLVASTAHAEVYQSKGNPDATFLKLNPSWQPISTVVVNRDLTAGEEWHLISEAFARNNIGRFPGGKRINVSFSSRVVACSGLGACETVHPPLQYSLEVIGGVGENIMPKRHYALSARQAHWVVPLDMPAPTTFELQVRVTALDKRGQIEFRDYQQMLSLKKED